MQHRKARPRICHLTSVHDHDDTRVFIKQCCSLAAAGYETHFVVPDAPGAARDGVYFHSIPRPHGNRLQRMTQTVWAVYQKALSLKADLYHFHDPELIPIGLLLRAKGKRVIYDIHEDVPRQVITKQHLPPWTRRPISVLMERLENLAGQRFSALVVATPTIGARFRTINARTVVVSNYPLRDELSFAMDMDWKDRAQAVAYVGGITLTRGIVEMVTAMEYVAPRLGAALELGGNFFYPRDRDRVAQLAGWAHVTELGWLNRDQVTQMFGRSRAGLVVLHPTQSYTVSQPVKLYEYMSAGLPVIVSDFPLWREFVGQIGCGLLVDPLDPRAIGAAIEFMLTQPDEAEAMGRRGREAIEQCYNWEHESTRLINLYQAVLESNAYSPAQAGSAIGSHREGLG